MSLKQLKEQYSDLHNQLEQIQSYIDDAFSIAVREPSYTNVGVFQKLREQRVILECTIMENIRLSGIANELKKEATKID